MDGRSIPCYYIGFLGGLCTRAPSSTTGRHSSPGRVSSTANLNSQLEEASPSPALHNSATRPSRTPACNAAARMDGNCRHSADSLRPSTGMRFPDGSLIPAEKEWSIFSDGDTYSKLTRRLFARMPSLWLTCIFGDAGCPRKVAATIRCTNRSRPAAFTVQYPCAAQYPKVVWLCCLVANRIRP